MPGNDLHIGTGYRESLRDEIDDGTVRFPADGRGRDLAADALAPFVVACRERRTLCACRDIERYGDTFTGLNDGISVWFHEKSL